MGNSGSRQQSPATPNVKINKDHKRDKTFRVGLSFGKGDLSAEGHFQMGYVSKTKKVYSRLVEESEPIPIPVRKLVTFKEEPEVRVISDNDGGVGNDGNERSR